MRCPFGCRDKRGTEKANARSARHYRTQKGWMKKAEFNRQRSLKSESELALNEVVVKPKGDEDAPSHLILPSVLQYIAALLWQSGLRPIPQHEIESFLREIHEWLWLTILRQRSLQGRGS
jgi:hypothetical protein